METENLYTMRESAPMLGVGYMTLYRWVRAGKLTPEIRWGRKLLTIDQLEPLVIKRCRTCYHHRNNGVCSCRELSDMSDPCADWAWKWNSTH